MYCYLISMMNKLIAKELKTTHLMSVEVVKNNPRTHRRING